MSRVKIPVSELEFERKGQTIWIHGPQGNTILRIKCTGKIIVNTCTVSDGAHGDVMVPGNMAICVPAKARKVKK